MNARRILLAAVFVFGCNKMTGGTDGGDGRVEVGGAGGASGGQGGAPGQAAQAVSGAAAMLASVGTAVETIEIPELRLDQLAEAPARLEGLVVAHDHELGRCQGA